MSLKIYISITLVIEEEVTYLGAADNVSRLLPSPLSDVNQPVIRSHNPFSRPHPAHVA
jgi:hypothetical protein